MNTPWHTYNREAMIKWYNENAKTYDEQTFVKTDDMYGGDSYRIELVAQLLAKHKPAKTLDIGCGTAQPMMRFLKEGYDVKGFDLSSGMIEQAKAKLKAAGFDPNNANVGDLLDPKTVETYGKESFDCIVANGVFPYIQDDATGHKHVAQMLKPGGLYIGAYCNELFDLVTFNRFTVKFHQKNFVDPLPVSQDVKNKIMDGIRGLMTRPDDPKSIPGGARDEIYIGSHNPMTIGDTLQSFGLVQEDMCFYKFHAFPPLLKGTDATLSQTFMEQSRSKEVKDARDWRAWFLASTFIVIARKQGATTRAS